MVVDDQITVTIAPSPKLWNRNWRSGMYFSIIKRTFLGPLIILKLCNNSITVFLKPMYLHSASPFLSHKSQTFYCISAVSHENMACCKTKQDMSFFDSAVCNDFTWEHSFSCDVESFHSLSIMHKRSTLWTEDNHSPWLPENHMHKVTYQTLQQYVCIWPICYTILHCE